MFQRLGCFANGGDITIVAGSAHRPARCSDDACASWALEIRRCLLRLSLPLPKSLPLSMILRLPARRAQWRSANHGLMSGGPSRLFNILVVIEVGHLARDNFRCDVPSNGCERKVARAIGERTKGRMTRCGKVVLAKQVCIGLIAWRDVAGATRVPTNWRSPNIYQHETRCMGSKANATTD